jgi:hypothetical protein
VAVETLKDRYAADAIPNARIGQAGGQVQHPLLNANN